MSRTLRIVSFTLLLAAFAGPAARAAPWGALDWLDRLRSALGSIWAENGCGLDPSGHCGAVAIVNGCRLDPNGHCDGVSVANGCSLDSDGICNSAPIFKGRRLGPDSNSKDRL